MTEDQFMHRVMLFAVLVQKDWRLADSTNQVRRKHKRRSVKRNADSWEPFKRKKDPAFK